MAIRDKLATEIKDRLKTFADNNGVAFNVALDIKKQQERYIFLTQTQINATPQQQYTPVNLTFESQPTGTPSQDKVIWGITLECTVPTVKEETQYFIDTKQALEDLRRDLRIDNSRFTVTEGSDTYECKSTATDLSRIELIEFQAGLSYVRYQMSISIVSGVGIAFGRDEQYELQKQTSSDTDFVYTVLNTLEKNGGTAVESDPKPIQGTPLSKYKVETGAWGDTVSIDFDKNLLAHQDLYNKAMDNSDPTEVYDLRIKKPFTLETFINKKVYVEVTRVANGGEAMLLTIKFIEVLE